MHEEGVSGLETEADFYLQRRVVEHLEAIAGAGTVGIWAEATVPVPPGRSWIAKLCPLKSRVFADLHCLRCWVRGFRSEESSWGVAFLRCGLRVLRRVIWSSPNQGHMPVLSLSVNTSNRVANKPASGHEAEQESVFWVRAKVQGCR